MMEHVIFDTLAVVSCRDFALYTLLLLRSTCSRGAANGNPCPVHLFKCNGATHDTFRSWRVVEPPYVCMYAVHKTLLCVDESADFFPEPVFLQPFVPPYELMYRQVRSRSRAPDCHPIKNGRRVFTASFAPSWHMNITRACPRACTRDMCNWRCLRALFFFF